MDEKFPSTQLDEESKADSRKDSSEQSPRDCDESRPRDAQVDSSYDPDVIEMDLDTIDFNPDIMDTSEGIERSACGQVGDTDVNSPDSFNFDVKGDAHRAQSVEIQGARTKVTEEFSEVDDNGNKVHQRDSQSSRHEMETDPLIKTDSTSLKDSTETSARQSGDSTHYLDTYMSDRNKSVSRRRAQSIGVCDSARGTHNFVPDDGVMDVVAGFRHDIQRYSHNTVYTRHRNRSGSDPNDRRRLQQSSSRTFRVADRTIDHTDDKEDIAAKNQFPNRGVYRDLQRNALGSRSSSIEGIEGTAPATPFGTNSLNWSTPALSSRPGRSGSDSQTWRLEPMRVESRSWGSLPSNFRPNTVESRRSANVQGLRPSPLSQRRNTLSHIHVPSLDPVRDESRQEIQTPCNTLETVSDDGSSALQEFRTQRSNSDSQAWQSNPVRHVSRQESMPASHSLNAVDQSRTSDTKSHTRLPVEEEVKQTASWDSQKQEIKYRNEKAYNAQHRWSVNASDCEKSSLETEEMHTGRLDKIDKCDSSPEAHPKTPLFVHVIPTAEDLPEMEESDVLPALDETSEEKVATKTADSPKKKKNIGSILKKIKRPNTKTEKRIKKLPKVSIQEPVVDKSSKSPDKHKDKPGLKTSSLSGIRNMLKLTSKPRKVNVQPPSVEPSETQNRASLEDAFRVNPQSSSQAADRSQTSEPITSPTRNISTAPNRFTTRIRLPTPVLDLSRGPPKSSSVEPIGPNPPNTGILGLPNLDGNDSGGDYMNVQDSTSHVRSCSVEVHPGSIDSLSMSDVMSPDLPEQVQLCIPDCSKTDSGTDIYRNTALEENNNNNLVGVHLSKLFETNLNPTKKAENTPNEGRVPTVECLSIEIPTEEYMNNPDERIVCAPTDKRQASVVMDNNPCKADTHVRDQANPHGGANTTENEPEQVIKTASGKLHRTKSAREDLLAIPGTCITTSEEEYADAPPVTFIDLSTLLHIDVTQESMPVPAEQSPDHSEKIKSSPRNASSPYVTPKSSPCRSPRRKGGNSPDMGGTYVVGFCTVSWDRVIFAESPSAPGIPVVYRTAEERSSNPDRLNLDRRKLTVCPILEGEEQLRLLNYQHNLISKIQHLGTLKRLIFLDLYDNQIEEISGLTSLRSLRVLMLGKNRLKQIENLDSLIKLDVLDLHGNQIACIENLNHLTELRVLNLAGNQITHVRGLTGMDSLAELNLRRNKIRSVEQVDLLPNLQRLFLSYNEIASFEDISCLGDSTSLAEISLDGNPLTQEQYYKQIVLRHMQQLKQLDMKRVTEEERRIALVMARKEEDKKREMSKMSVMKEKRRLAINNARRQWEVMQGSLIQKTSKLNRPQELYANFVGTVPNSEVISADNDGEESKDEFESITSKPSSQTTSQANSQANSRPSSAHSFTVDGGDTRDRPRTANLQTRRGDGAASTGKPGVYKETMMFGTEKGSTSLDNLAELEGDTLTLYGPQSLEALDRNWGIQAAGAVTVIIFKFIDFVNIAKHLFKIRTRFPAVQSLIFNSTNICSLQQINALTSVRRLDYLTIELEGNPVTNHSLWRSYILFRLSHFALKKVNDVEVTAADVINAEKLFGAISQITTAQLPQSRLLSLLGETRRKQLLTMSEEKSRKILDGTMKMDKSQGEFVGRAGLTYQPDNSKQQDLQGKQAFAKSYIHEITREAFSTDRKRNELNRIWPQIFHELVYSALSDFADTPAYMKKCLEDLDKS